MGYLYTKLILLLQPCIDLRVCLVGILQVVILVDVLEPLQNQDTKTVQVHLQFYSKNLSGYLQKKCYENLKTEIKTSWVS
jgi:hypothetical protein